MLSPTNILHHDGAMTPLEKTSAEYEALLTEAKPAEAIILQSAKAAETTHDLQIELRERAEEMLQFTFDGLAVNVELQNPVTTPQGVIELIRNRMRLTVEAPRIAA